MSDTVAQFVTDLVAAWNSHDAERVSAFYAAEYEGRDVGETVPRHGPQGARETLARYLGAFPDIYFSTDETIVQGNRVALAWTARGTHRGPLMNIPPTGRAVQVRGVSLLTVERGQVVRASYIWDVAGLLRTFGLLPEL